MDSIRSDSAVGRVAVSDELLGRCVAESVLDTEGVVCMADNIQNGISINLPGLDHTMQNSVLINRRDDRTDIDVYVICAYGTSIPTLAWSLQNKVRKDVKAITGLDVHNVNIHVQGVRIKEKDNEQT